MLVDLYLRKTKFNKMKIPTKKTDTTDVKLNSEKINKSNIDLTELLHIFHFT